MHVLLLLTPHTGSNKSTTANLTWQKREAKVQATHEPGLSLASVAPLPLFRGLGAMLILHIQISPPRPHSVTCSRAALSDKTLPNVGSPILFIFYCYFSFLLTLRKKEKVLHHST